jgi:hypothetical protein
LFGGRFRHTRREACHALKKLDGLARGLPGIHLRTDARSRSAEHKPELFKFLFMRLAGDMQPLLHWSTFEATYRRIGYAFAAPEGQSGGCCNACSGNSCMVGNQRVRSGG